MPAASVSVPWAVARVEISVPGMDPHLQPMGGPWETAEGAEAGLPAADLALEWAQDSAG